MKKLALIALCLSVIVAFSSCKSQNVNVDELVETVTSQVSSEDVTSSVLSDVSSNSVSTAEKSSSKAVSEIQSKAESKKRVKAPQTSSKKSKQQKTTSNTQATTQEVSSIAASSDSSVSQIMVSVSIDCITAARKGDRVATAVSNNGIMLDNMNVALKTGSTVFDALKAVESNNPALLIVSENSGLGVYVKSIGSLAEKMLGAESGWQYFVNGEYKPQSCDSYILENGDKIAWRYTCNQGGDLK